MGRRLEIGSVGVGTGGIEKTVKGCERLGGN